MANTVEANGGYLFISPMFGNIYKLCVQEDIPYFEFVNTFEASDLFRFTSSTIFKNKKQLFVKLRENLVATGFLCATDKTNPFTVVLDTGKIGSVPIGIAKASDLVQTQGVVGGFTNLAPGALYGYENPSSKTPKQRSDMRNHKHILSRHA